MQEFASFGDSVKTCFGILLGNIDVNTKLRELGGLQSAAGAVFFWSYELLVFMVLLNFLLAIIVDAFSVVRAQQAHAHTLICMAFTCARVGAEKGQGARSPSMRVFMQRSI